MRISDLDQITNEAMDLSQFIALDDPGQTFKATLLQIADFMQSTILGRVFNVGSTLYRVDNRTPNQAGFPGVWVKASPDVTLATGLADGTDTGSYSGNNSPVVPVPLHGHTADMAPHTHSADVHPGGAHNHIQGENTQRGNHYGLSGVDLASNEVYDNGKSGDPSLPYTSTSSDHDHGITIGSSDAAITVSNTGTDGATLDVRGLHLNGQLWLRTE